MHGNPMIAPTSINMIERTLRNVGSHLAFYGWFVGFRLERIAHDVT